MRPANEPLEVVRSKRFSGDLQFETEHLKVDLGGRAARGGAVTFGWHGLKFVVGIVATAFMARLLTPREYGLIGMVAVFTSFMSMFKDMGLSLATVQKPEINDKEISTLFWVNAALSIGITLITMALAPLIAWFYAEPLLVAITIVSSMGFIIGGLAVQHEALLKRQMRFFGLGLISFFSMLFGYGVGIALAWRGWGYWALVLSQLTLVTTQALGVWVLCGWRPSRPQRSQGIGSMLVFGRNLTGYAIVNVLAKNMDGLLIGRVWGAQQLGLYSKAAQLLSLPTDQLNEPLNSVAIPTLSRLTDSPKRYREAYLRVLEKIAMITMPGIALMIATSDWLVSLLLGPQWVDVGYILVLLAIAGITQPLTNTTGWLLITQGRTHHMFQWALISAPLGIISVIAGLPWGAAGVAISYSLVRVCITDRVLFWFVGREGPIRMMDFYRTIAPAACAAGCALLSVILFRKFVAISNPLHGMLASFAITVVITLGVLFTIPAGRSGLLDLSRSLLLMRRQPRESLAQP